MQQKIIVTALPGIKEVPGNSKMQETTFFVSAAISLQVTDANTTLASIDDFREWPARIRNAAFSVYINDKEVEAEVISAKPDAELWGLLFPSGVTVNSFPSAKTMAAREIISYPVRHIIDHISKVMQETGQKFVDTLPDATHYTNNDLFKAIAGYVVKDYDRANISKGRTLQDEVIKKDRPRQFIEKTLSENKFIAFAPNPNAEADFTQLRLFHGFYNKKDFTVKTPVPKFEFHDILSALTTYPQLLRVLGLVIDVKLKSKNIPPTGSVRIIPKGINFSKPTTIQCPPTAYIVGKGGFYSRPDSNAAGNISMGHLKIDSQRYTLFQLDTDGGALKLAQQIDGLLLKKAKQNFHAQQGLLGNANEFERFYNQARRSEGLPSQRTAGIAIARNGIAERLHQTFVRMTAVESEVRQHAATIGNLPPFNGSYVLSSKLLFADDVNMGFRMDVMQVNKSTAWLSLHKRKNNYSFPTISAKTWIFGEDEGFVQLAGSTDKRYSDTHIKVGETIARWEGWSLSVPKPGRSLNDRLSNDNSDNSGDVPTSYANEKAKFQNAGQANFKLQVLSDIIPGTLPKLRFGETYAIRLRTVDIAGNGVSVETQPEEPEAISKKIVYKRYEPTGAPSLVMGNVVKDGESSEQIVLVSNDSLTPAEYAAKANLVFEPTIRHVKPPRTTVQMFEQHGLLDKVIGSKDVGQIQDMYERLRTLDMRFNKKSDDPTLSELPVVKDENAPIEYLADPMAAGVSIFLSQNDPNEKRWFSPAQVFRIVFSSGKLVTNNAENIEFDPWTPKTFRVQLIDAQNTKEPLKWVEEERTLLVAIPKGFICKLNYSCFWRPQDINSKSGVLDMLQLDSLPAEDKEKILAKVHMGQHWMFSPWREMTLVHAVQQPMDVAKINTLVPERALNESNVYLKTTISVVHSQSTDKVDIEAEWTERIDDVSKDGPETIVVSSKVFNFNVTYGRETYNFIVDEKDQKPPFLAKIKHQFADTRHRFVTYKTIATTRYREYFTSLKNRVEKNNGRPGAINQFLPLTREFIFQQKINILSSVRPVAPHLAYVIPSFQWEKFSRGNVSTKTRTCALRVYLHRPWYSSGEGEQLAVVLLPSGAPGSKDVQLQNFTNWATDPIRKTGTLSSHFPGVAALINRDISTQKLQTGATTSAALFNVTYDAERHLYFTDIIIDAGNVATPFIKLALARYQEHSVKNAATGVDCSFSPTVMCDYIQVLPTRKTSLQFNGANNNFTISVNGIAIDHTRIVVSIDELNIAVSDSSYISVIATRTDNNIGREEAAAQPSGNLAGSLFSKQFTIPDLYKSRPFTITISEFEVGSTENSEGKSLAKRKLLFTDVYEVNTGR